MSRVHVLDALDIDLSIAHSIKSIRQLHVANIENCRCNYNSTFQRQYRYDFEKINSKMFSRVEGNYWYKLEHYTTGRNDYTGGESDFCRILEHDTLMKSS